MIKYPSTQAHTDHGPSGGCLSRSQITFLLLNPALIILTNHQHVISDHSSSLQALLLRPTHFPSPDRELIEKQTQSLRPKDLQARNWKTHWPHPTVTVTSQAGLHLAPALISSSQASSLALPYPQIQTSQS